MAGRQSALYTRTSASTSHSIRSHREILLRELDITEALLMMTATARVASPFTIFHATPSSQLATLRIWYSVGLKMLQHDQSEPHGLMRLF